jgi:hypothetical protein
METHWNTVNMASPMLSKLEMPKLGPSHFSRQMDRFRSHVYEPIGESASGPGKHGDPAPPSSMISSEKKE